ncbi:MAG: TetR/AcrR family transcriptional regulator, partial [Candidatus Faecousia sp.]|nr:TetR/AcrR family transcriptional regulator [Candidatus Faecousia sp.]
MANFTKKAIRDSFVKLLNEKPISQITVKDIVEDCGVNRNTFYYYYQDLPQLMEN